MNWCINTLYHNTIYIFLYYRKQNNNQRLHNILESYYHDKLDMLFYLHMHHRDYLLILLDLN